jgi:hypothetical protein
MGGNYIGALNHPASMTKRNIIIFGLAALILLILAFPAFTTLRITAPMIDIPIIITRNGKEVAQEQIRKVQYSVSVDLPKPTEEIREKSLREARNDQGFYFIAAAFTIYRSGFFFPSTTVKPDYHSVFLRITFADGKILSSSFPIISDTRENHPLYIDLSETQH